MTKILSLSLIGLFFVLNAPTAKADCDIAASIKTANSVQLQTNVGAASFDFGVYNSMNLSTWRFNGNANLVTNGKVYITAYQPAGGGACTKELKVAIINVDVPNSYLTDNSKAWIVKALELCGARFQANKSASFSVGVASNTAANTVIIPNMNSAGDGVTIYVKTTAAGFDSIRCN